MAYVLVAVLLALMILLFRYYEEVSFFAGSAMASCVAWCVITYGDIVQRFRTPEVEELVTDEPNVRIFHVRFDVAPDEESAAARAGVHRVGSCDRDGRQIIRVEVSRSAEWSPWVVRVTYSPPVQVGPESHLSHLNLA